MPETLTLRLPDSVASVLHSKASFHGEKVEAIAGEMIVSQIESEMANFDPETVAAIREGIADGEAGREQPFEEYVAEMQTRRSERTAARPQ